MDTKLDCLKRIDRLSFEIEFRQNIDTGKPLSNRRLNIKRQAKTALEQILGA